MSQLNYDNMRRMDLRYRVKEHRKRLGWTLDHLSDVSGVSKGFLSQIENGRRAAGSKTLRALADALKVDPSELISPEGAEAADLIEHLGIFSRLSPEAQKAVSEHAAALLKAQGAE